jgi:hypothetical protein
MFTVHQVNNGYIVRDEFGAKVGWFQEKYYADLFCSLVNAAAQQSRAGGRRTESAKKVNWCSGVVFASRRR